MWLDYDATWFHLVQRTWALAGPGLGHPKGLYLANKWRGRGAGMIAQIAYLC